jgi:hypothetical protein
MARHSKHERERRAAETESTREIASAWFASLPKDVAAAFTADVAEARARGPLPPPPDMAPGTAPNPPRPGREPKPAADERGPRRRSY